MKKHKSSLILVLLLIMFILSGCNSNLPHEISNFCEDRNPNPEDYKYVESTIKNYNYEDTQIKCSYYKGTFSFKYEKIKVYNISCSNTFTCNKYDDWGDCTSGDFDYDCN